MIRTVFLLVVKILAIAELTGSWIFFIVFPIADEAATLRVTNLSEDAMESDIQELFRPFGPIARVYLAKDKLTNQSKVRANELC